MRVEKDTTMKDLEMFKPVDYSPKKVKNLTKNGVVSVSYSTSYIRRPVKTQAENILWVKPEDTLYSLFKRASYYVQSQKRWNTEDYASALRFFITDYSFQVASSYSEYIRQNTGFLDGEQKKALSKTINAKSVRHVLKLQTSLTGTIYLVLQSSKQIDAKHEGAKKLINGKQVVFIDSDKIIGEKEIWQQFSKFLDKEVATLKNYPMNGFEICISVIKDMLLTGLVNGSYANKHQNYSALEQAVDALTDKYSDDYLDLNNWKNFTLIKAFAYRLFARFLAVRFHHSVKSDASKDSDYRDHACSVLYVLDNKPQKPKIHVMRRPLRIPDGPELIQAEKPFSQIKFETQSLKEKTEDVLASELISLFRFLPIVKRKPTLIFTSEDNSYNIFTNEMKVAVSTVGGINAPQFIIQYGRVLNAQYYPQAWFPNFEENMGNMELISDDEVFLRIINALKLKDEERDISFGVALEIYLMTLNVNSKLMRSARSVALNEKDRYIRYKFELQIINYFEDQFPDIRHKLYQRRK